MHKNRFISLIITILISINIFANNEELEKASVKISQILYLVDNFYVDTVNIPQLTEVAITNILKELDPHSTYISSQDVAQMNSYIQGNFEGIGISYQMLDDTICVNQTITGCPAEKVGILPGDRITHVDSTNIAGVKMKISQIPKLIRGPKGSEVAIRVVRHGEKEPLLFKIIRDKIPINSVDAAFYVKEGIGYIKLNSFSVTTTDEIDKAIKKLKREGKLKSLILDLQSNGGGVMAAAVDLVNLFIPANKLIVYTEGEHQRRININSSTGKKLKDIDLVVLIDEHSASASEITAGGLQDWDRATIIGRRSFGKGLVQRPIPLSDGSEIRLTVSRYYTPSGRNIQKPYDQGSDKYYKDIENRYKHGEFIHSDSISFPDSLKYKTLIKERSVYGGGGIFPDIFVPFDTMRYSKYYKEIVAKGIFNKTISTYVDQNREKLKGLYPTFEEFNESFKIKDELMDKMIKAGEKEKIIFKKSEFIQSRRVIKLQAKAVIAQALYGTNYYFEVIYTENDALSKAIEYLDKGNNILESEKQKK